MTQKQRQRPASDSKKKVFIVDDHPVVRDGLITLIEHEQDLKVCGDADDAAEAIKSVSSLKPDVVIVDIGLKSSDGIELTKSIKMQHPRLPVVVFSIHDESVYAERALRAGASAYLMKEVISENVITAVRAVLRGEIYVSDQIAKKFLGNAFQGKSDAGTDPVSKLSNREFEIFRLIGAGYKASQIADRMHLSVKTIETYRARIKEKLNISDASKLLRYAIKWVSSDDRK
ncbi:MAG: response regulator transcription factor [Phycisphaerae bacterium]|nr:response regulator transcription factor [Phycisphaerae bacterium]